MLTAAVHVGMALQQLIYSSAAVHAFGAIELSSLLLTARTTNERLGVTGMLLYHDGSFLQVLEGDEGTVEMLFERIGRDPRHSRVLVLLRRSIEAQQFQHWSMGFVDVKSVAAGLPGYSDFLRHRSDPARAGSLAAKVLAQFCEGRFRNLVASR